MLDEITNVTVRGYNGMGGGSRLIRWFTFGKFSHVSLVFWFADDHAEEWEALQGETLEPHEPRNSFDLARQVPLTPEQMLDAHLLCCQLQDAEYDWMGIWGLLLRRFGFHSPNRWFCSELVAYVLLKAGYPLSRREPYRETPTSIMESLRLSSRRHR